MCTIIPHSRFHFTFCENYVPISVQLEAGLDGPRSSTLSVAEYGEYRLPPWPYSRYSLNPQDFGDMATTNSQLIAAHERSLDHGWESLVGRYQLLRHLKMNSC